MNADIGSDRKLFFSGATFMFEQDRYFINEGDDSFEICVQLVSGALQRRVVFSVTPGNDSDPMTSNGKLRL